MVLQIFFTTFILSEAFSGLFSKTTWDREELHSSRPTLMNLGVEKLFQNIMMMKTPVAKNANAY